MRRLRDNTGRETTLVGNIENLLLNFCDLRQKPLVQKDPRREKNPK